MTEHVIVRQNNKFEIDFQAANPNDPDSGELRSVSHIHELDPYAMLLAGVGACTAIVLHAYAQNHGVDLREVELDLKYRRNFQRDSQDAETADGYEEQIEEELTFTGDLTEEDRQKLSLVAKQCSIHRMLEDGIKIGSRLTNGTGSE